MNLPNANPEVIEDAIAAWTRAHESTEEGLSQFRKQKNSTLTRSSLPGKLTSSLGQQMVRVNIYEFFSKFEEWSAGTFLFYFVESHLQHVMHGYV
jgi:hypothetical protein